MVEEDEEARKEEEDVGPPTPAAEEDLSQLMFWKYLTIPSPVPKSIFRQPLTNSTTPIPTIFT